MTLPGRVAKHLAKHEAEYEHIIHKTVFTAYDAAQTLKRQLKEIAKTLLIQADKTFVLVIIPADKKLDMVRLKKVLGVGKVSIPNEKVMVRVLKIKPGAVASFGTLHKLEVIVDKALATSQKVIFSTGSFTDSVLMKVKDFIRIEEAKVAQIAIAGGYKLPKPVKKQMKKALRQAQGKRKKKFSKAKAKSKSKSKPKTKAKAKPKVKAKVKTKSKAKSRR